MNLAQSQNMLAAGSDLLVYGLPVMGSMLLCFGLYQVWTETRRNDRKKLQDRLKGGRAKRDKSMDSILRRGAMGNTSSFADKIVGKLKVVPKLQTLLNQADVAWSASQTLVNLFCGAALVTVLLMVLKFNPLLALGCGAAFIGVPLFTLSFMRKRRLSKLTNQLPDVFEMMSQALRAGHSLAGAIQLVHEQLPPPVAAEFGQVYHEQNLGLKIEDSLQAMADRVDSLDVRFFVTAVAIQRQTGGDLAEVLDNISGVIRERIELYGLVQSLTAEGRLSGWVLFALPIVVFAGVLGLNPEYGHKLLDESTGRIMLMVAGGMQLMGLAMIRWIVNIKV